MKYKNIKEKLAGRLMLSLVVSMMLALSVYAENMQGSTVTGIVRGSLDGVGLPGVNVILKGSQEGTITDINGNYSVDIVDETSVLVFSYVGFNSEEILVGDKTVIDVELFESLEALGEIVVTALGIKRDERSLGYSVGKVDGESVNRVVHENVLGSLAGKVAGATVNTTGATGSTISMVIRGATSLSTDNQPLFVVDGVPMKNSLNNLGQFGDRNIVDYGNAISDLNPDDVESITVLKGASAAALYGTRAGNGVVLITTKKAKKNQGMQLSVISNTVFDIPSSYLNMQKQFASGGFSWTPADFGGGVLPPINDEQSVGAGPELDKGYWAVQYNSPLDANGYPIPTEVVSYPNNIENFVQTGYTTTNGLALSNSTDLVNYRVGFTNMSSRGNVPNSDLFKNNFSTSASLIAAKNVTFSTSVNYSKTWSNNRPSSNRGTNPLEAAYKTPVNVDILDFENYWVEGKEGVESRTVSSNHENPYFLAYEVQNAFDRERFWGNAMVEWQIVPDFNIMARYVMDRTNGTRETKIAPGYSREPNNGAYGLATNETFERNIDVLATYSKVWQNFNLTVSAGGNGLYAKNSLLSNSSKNGAGLIVPNLYNVTNIASSALNYRSYWSQRAIYSAYGLVNVGWKDWIYLDVTYRNDWSSTLPSDNQSYSYPSASVSLLINEMTNLGNNISLLKVRGGYAQVGNDTSPYNLYPVYGNSGQWGDAIRMNKSGTILVPELKPELATSIEIGMDFNMFQDRLRFEGTVYSVDNENQILSNIPLAVSSGFNNININAGLIESKGVEIMLGGTPIQNANWNWDINVNFAKNESKIIELAPGVDVIEFWSDNKSYSYGYIKDDAIGEDGLVGNIYSSLKQRVTDPTSEYYGYPLINECQCPDSEWLAEDKPVKVGNYNPDFIMGLQTRLSYKNFVLNMTFDWRNGGQYMSQTYRYSTEDVMTQTWLNNLANPGDLRLGQDLEDWVVANADELLYSEDLKPVGGPTAEYGGFPESYSGVTVNDGTFAPGVVGHHDEDGTFILDHKNLGGDETTIIPYVASNAWDFGTQNMFDADFVKLREVSIGYYFPKEIAKKMGMQNAVFSIYSRNIMLWTKDSDFGIDPERAFQAESSSGNRGTQFKQGIERYNVDPWVIPIGFKFDLTF